MDYLRVLANRRQLAVLCLGFASGLPIALCGSTLQAWFTVTGISIVTIGLLSLTGQPYLYKFLWAPILDRYVPPFLGRRRGWILLMQFALTIVIATMGFLDPKNNTLAIAMMALLLAFFSSTQDIGINAYTTDVLKPEERGMGAALTTLGYRIAMLVSGGIALVLAAKYGWRLTYLLMALIMVAEMAITFFSPEITYRTEAPATLYSAVINPFREFMSRPFAVAILVFIILYKLSDAFALSLGSTFLLRGVGFSLEQVGIAYKLVSMIATIAGALIGGALMPRLGLYRGLLIFGVLQGVSNLMYLALALVGKSLAFMIITVFVESFCSGAGTVAFVALLMTLCDHRYTATQYALLSAFSGVGRVFVGPIAAIAVEHIGWAWFYFGSTIIAIPGLLLLVKLRDSIKNAMNMSAKKNENYQSNIEVSP